MLTRHHKSHYDKAIEGITMANVFKNGQVVQLKSGGPSMTVAHSPGEATGHYPPGSKYKAYLCVWFKGATRDQADFEEHLLQPYVAPTK